MRMSEYNSEDFYPILVRCLSEGIRVPFNCFIHLHQSNRIVLWIKSDTEIPSRKFQRLQSFEVKKIYIPIQEKTLYFQWLDHFLQSQSGTSVLAEIRNEASSHVEGLPEKGEFQLKALDPNFQPDSIMAETLREVDNNGEVPIGKVNRQDEDLVPEITTGEQMTSIEDRLIDGSLDSQDPDLVGLGSIGGGIPEESDLSANQGIHTESDDVVEVTGNVDQREENIDILGKVTVEGDSSQLVSGVLQSDNEEMGNGDESPPYAEVFDILRTKIKDLEDKIRVTGTFQEQDVKKISDCTLKIKDDVFMVTSDVENGKFDPQSLQEVVKKVRSSLQSIQTEVKTDPLGSVSLITKELEEHIKNLNDVSLQKKPKMKKLSRLLQTIIHKTHQLDEVTSGDTNLLLSSSLNQMIAHVQDQTGKRVHLSSDLGEYDLIPEYLSSKIDLDDLTASDNLNIKHFQHKIIQQSLIINDLNNKYKSSQESFKNLRQKWYLFHVQAKKNLSGSDALAAKEIDTDFRHIETQVGEVTKSSGKLTEMAAHITNDIGGSEIKVDMELLKRLSQDTTGDQFSSSSATDDSGDQFQFDEDLVEISEDKFKNDSDGDSKDNSEYPQNITADELIKEMEGRFGQQPNSKISAETSSLMAENQLLKTQLENSQQLLNSANNKIDELNQLMEKNNELTSKLEDESLENRKLIETLESRVEILQSTETRFNDTISEAGANLKLVKAEISDKDLMIQELRNDLSVKKLEVNSLKKIKIGKIWPRPRIVRYLISAKSLLRSRRKHPWHVQN